MSWGLGLPYRRSMSLESNDFNENGKGYIDLKTRMDKQSNRSKRFEVTGIMVVSDPSFQPAVPSDNISAINGILWDDEPDARTTYIIDMFKPVNLRFKRIYKSGTTATRVIILGQ